MSDSKQEIIKIAPSNDWKDEDQQMYEEYEVTFYDKDIICLIGCNGSGKTTFLEQVEQQARMEMGYLNIDAGENPFSRIFSSLADKDKPINGFLAKFHRGFDTGYDDMQTIGVQMQSTGEELVTRLVDLAKLLVKYAGKAQKQNVPMILLFDDCDVGTSIDMQDDIIKFIKELDSELTKKNVQHAIIITANSYELAKSFDCIDLYTGKRIKFESYDAYKVIVLASRKHKDMRHNNNV